MSTKFHSFTDATEEGDTDVWNVNHVCDTGTVRAKNKWVQPITWSLYKHFVAIHPADVEMHHPGAKMRTGSVSKIQRRPHLLRTISGKHFQIFFFPSHCLTILMRDHKMNQLIENNTEKINNHAGNLITKAWWYIRVENTSNQVQYSDLDEFASIQKHLNAFINMGHLPFRDYSHFVHSIFYCHRLKCISTRWHHCRYNPNFKHTQGENPLWWMTAWMSPNSELPSLELLCQAFTDPQSHRFIYLTINADFPRVLG